MPRECAVYKLLAHPECRNINGQRESNAVGLDQMASLKFCLASIRTKRFPGGSLTRACGAIVWTSVRHTVA